MANRFNQIIDQQYVQLPFQEIMYASQMREKQGDQNRNLLDSTLDATSKLKAMPGADEAEVKQYQKGVNDLVQSYISDPKKLYNPNSIYNFRNDIRSLTDPTLLNNIQTSYTNYEQSLLNDKTLGNQGKLREQLQPNYKVHNTREGGVFNDFTLPYEDSKMQSKAYFDDVQPDTVFDETTGLSYQAKSPEKLLAQADRSAEQYSQTPNFLAQLKVRGVDPNSIDANTKVGYAQEILRNDAKEYMYGKESGFKPASFGHGYGGKSKLPVAPTIPDPAYDMKAKEVTSLTSDDLDALGLSKVQDTKTGKIGNQVDFTPTNTVQEFGQYWTSDPRDQLALQIAGQIGDLQLEHDAMLGSPSKRGEGFNFNFDEFWNYIPKSSEYKAKIQALNTRAEALLGHSVDLTTKEGFEKYQSEVRKKAGLPEGSLTNDMGTYGAAIDALNSGTGLFIPSNDKSNKINIVDASGAIKHKVIGKTLLTTSQIDEKLTAIGFDNYGDIDPFNMGDKDWDKVFVKESGGNGLISYEGENPTTKEKIWSLKTAVGVNMDDDRLDLVNQKRLGTEFNAKIIEEQHSRRDIDKKDRMTQYYEGVTELPNIEKLLNEGKAAIANSSYSTAWKAHALDEFNNSIASGQPFQVGHAKRLINELKEPTSFREGLKAAEGNNPYDLQPTQSGTTASGKYQIIDSTWNQYNNTYNHAYEAPGEVQDAVVEEIRKDSEQTANSLLDRYSSAKLYTPAQLTAMVYFLGEGDAETYLAVLEKTGNRQSAQYAVNENIRQKTGGKPPKNTSVEEYLRQFKNRTPKT